MSIGEKRGKSSIIGFTADYRRIKKSKSDRFRKYTTEIDEGLIKFYGLNLDGEIIQ